jgi:nitroimidazol reductase NimA-like FMN-containing flavoprotein (pyridoxamine 5'-phosphate oxidase superfamily)
MVAFTSPMIGELDAAEIDDVLRTEVLGRIGCVANGWPYVVPVGYVYEGDSVYAQTPDGLKLQAMRENPMVCFEVEQIRSMSNWRTVIVRGRFEELFRDQQERAMGIIRARLAHLDTSATARVLEQDDVHARAGFRRPVLFRIRVEDRSGRFELV